MLLDSVGEVIIRTGEREQRLAIDFETRITGNGKIVEELVYHQQRRSM